MGTRDSANISETTILQFQFLHDGNPYDAFSVNSVTVYASEADAISGSNILQTIPSYSITRMDIGLYEYTVNLLTTEGIYYDKISITPTVTSSAIFFINEFYISDTPPTTSICYITGTIVSGDGEGMEGVSISATPFDSPALISGTGIALAPSVVSIVTTSTGSFELSLLRNVRFTVHIPEIGFKETILVPALESISLWGLTDIFATGEPPVTNPQEENTW
jgi:hypothetical protein